MESSEQHPTERCGRCNRPAPPPIPGPEGQVEQDWATYEGQAELVIYIPAEGAVLPLEVVEAIRIHDGLIRIETDPFVTVASVCEVTSARLGLACPDCQEETGWDFEQWSLFFATKEAA